MEKPQVKYLKDYCPPPFFIEKTELEIDLYEQYAIVNSKLKIKKNDKQAGQKEQLMLDGVGLELLSIFIDGSAPEPEDYLADDKSLCIFNVPANFTLETSVKIYPGKNTSLEGLYKSGNMFCTQCEAEGFRKITYFMDRPDVMSKYTCKIIADKTRYPVLLSNGNPVKSEDHKDGRHSVTWEDPFKKPSYLFALVAGDLFCFEDSFKTMSGRNVALKIFVEHENKDKCAFAMESLKKAMKWDEEVYGREYDLDIYMIVAVNDFNMGAMENKGLNIFNSKYVLAKPETATDTDYWNIERVIAHEYFHNWTGNRITLKNWFQLSLKEGLTVFRDQEFTMDMTSRPVKRIMDVRALRMNQFPEDAGPMAHPVRPASYIKMDNFYTVTVYEKGAEVIRMIRTILGKKGFGKGMDLYFERHDGQAVGIEEFVKAMEDANDVDLGRFMLWYSQAGTPQVRVDETRNPQDKTLSLTFTQHCPPTPDMKEKKPMHIPIAVGLIDQDGKNIPIAAVGLIDQDGKDIPMRASQAAGKAEETTFICNLKKQKETFTFYNITGKPVVSVLRGFSAPVKCYTGYDDEYRKFIFAHDSDEFNRWDAGQSLFTGMLLNMIRDIKAGKNAIPDGSVIEPFEKTLLNENLDKSFISLALTLPSESELAIIMSESDPIDPDLIHEARENMVKFIAKALKKEFFHIWKSNMEKSYSITPLAVGKRSLKHLAMNYLSSLKEPEITQAIYEEFEKAGNMTDEIAALSALSHIDCDQRTKAMNKFYKKWKGDTVVMDKWFAVQAGSKLAGTLENVKRLLDHPGFSIKNPNKVRALIGTFCSANPWVFHKKTGEGYEFSSDVIIELDSINPQIAARMSGVFNHWKKYEKNRRNLMKVQLEKIMKKKGLSENVYEIVQKALG